jgi:putative tricarboxylic transport membrane protein
MRAADLVTAGVLFLLAGIVLIDALRLGTGWGTDGPKSGFFPFWLAVALLLLCVAIFVRGWLRATPGPLVSREGLGPVMKVLVPATLMVLLTQVVGLYVAAALYLGTYMRWIGRHGWPLVVVLALGIPIATFVVFERWFLVPLPKGPLEDWLGF